MRIASTKQHNNEAREVLTREYLERQYVVNGRSACNIGKDLGVHQGIVIRQLQSFGFEVRSKSKHIVTKLKYADILSFEFLKKEYIEKERSMTDISNQFNIVPDIVSQYLKRYGFEIRGIAFYNQGDRHPCMGKQMLDKTKRAISEANKGKYDGSNNPFYGRKHTLETRQLISDHHADFSLENHPRWQGGKSFEPYGFEFDEQLKESIRQRDNHTCQLCGVPERECLEKLHCHHIDYDKENCLPSNLISLCRSCHSQTNNNRDYWIEYFSNKLLITA